MKNVVIVGGVVMIIGIVLLVDYRKHSERMSIAEMDIERAADLYQAGNFEQAERFLQEAQDYANTPGGMVVTARLWMGNRQDAVIHQAEELQGKLEVKLPRNRAKWPGH